MSAQNYDADGDESTANNPTDELNIDEESDLGKHADLTDWPDEVEFHFSTNNEFESNIEIIVNVRDVAKVTEKLVKQDWTVASSHPVKDNSFKLFVESDY
jgi:hypothetical protein